MTAIVSDLSDTVTVTDLFCGAGGSSTGAVQAGATVRLAANHWALAVQTHSSNHPTTDHDIADISQVEPRRYPSTTILLASPECTTHSLSGGRRHEPNLFNPDGDPRVERSRATMWDVPRFAEVHHYRCVIVENVVEIRRWAPYNAWLEAMRSLGYKHRAVFLNSMVAHPTPQSRDRVYIVFWLADQRAPDLDFRAKAWCPTCEVVVQAWQAWKRPERPGGRYKAQYFYRCPVCKSVTFPYAYPAASAIDWSLPVPRIGDRAKPLAEATRQRIRIGLERFAAALVQHGGHTYEAGDYARAWSVLAPGPTQTATLDKALACPPFLLNQMDPAGSADCRVRSVADLLATVVAGGHHHALVVPVHHGSDGPEARPATAPWPTQTGRQELALAIPMRTNGQPQEAAEGPLATVTTAHGGGQTLVTLPFIAELRGGSSTASPVTEPAATVTASGNHHALVVPYRGKGKASSPDVPLPTQDTRDRFALVIKNFGDGRDASMTHSPAEPFGAVTTQDHHSVVEMERAPIEVDDCGFRMLEPHEIQAAMAFPGSYVVLGSKRDKVRQLGNAVTPPVMALLVQRCVESLS